MRVNKYKSVKLLLIGMIITFLTSCTTLFEEANQYATQNDWLKAVLTYRKALNEHPDDIEIKSRLKQAELLAADYYYAKGNTFINQETLDEAIVMFQQGLIAMPENSKLQSAMKDVLKMREAESLYKEALANKDINKDQDAIKLLEQALVKYPEHKKANELLNRYRLDEKISDQNQLALTSKKPITLNFKSTELKTAFDFIVKSFGVNVIFDEGIKNVPITLYAHNVTFEQAISLMMSTTKTFYKKIGANTILVAPDTSEKRGQYEDHIIRTFHIKAISAKQMADILKNVLGLKKLVINEELNSVMVRETKEVLELCENLIIVNDRKPAELILDVEILEVNRTKAEQLGIDFGSQIGISYPSFTGSLSTALSAGTVTLPNITFRYFKQDVDAKTLANPKIRVIDNKKAKIHIGDRVPLRSATIQDATGQTRTTFEYKDIGIRLQVEPDIHLDNSVTVSLNLEVSSLGQNLGTADEPAFSIGTRNADTFMLLKDGETAILGGLIRDEDRKTRVKIPGLGDIPLIGSLFTSYDDSTTRTDVLLTITPHIVRTWELPPKKIHSLYSGTEKTYSTKPLFGFLETKAEGGAGASIRIGPAGSTQSTTNTGSSPGSQQQTHTQQATPGIPASESKLGTVSFGKGLYQTKKDEELIVEVFTEGIQNAESIPISVLFNSNLIEVIGVESDLATVQDDEAEKNSAGVYNFTLTSPNLNEGKSNVARVKLRAKQQGISYLIFKSVTYTSKAGDVNNARISASRVVIQ